MKRLRKLVLALMVALVMAAPIATSSLQAASTDGEIAFVDQDGTLIRLIWAIGRTDVVIDGHNCHYYGADREERYAAWLMNDFMGNSFADKCDGLTVLVNNLSYMDFFMAWMM
ncbi:MAG: hypothetical protein KBC81_01095 [Candidatus Pacebacteria bacterium]|nr:hypothetical protein [Candidatus Paceibacterota bacterium]